MALIVEDGTGLANAESYLSVADADAYHLAFGNEAWVDLTGDAKESALRRATQYIDSAYRFRGDRLTDDQALEWPRTLAPNWPIKRLANATAELALRAASGPLYTDQSGGEVLEETIGPVSVTYAKAGLAGQTRYAAVDALLSPYTGSGRFSVRMERAE